MKNYFRAVLVLLLTALVSEAQTVSRFDFDDPAGDEKIATIGPNATSSAAQANARPTGNGTPQGCAAGATPFGNPSPFCGNAGGCAQSINMAIPGAVFNVTKPTMSIDYRRPKREVDGWFWFKDSLAFGFRYSKITARLAYSNGGGGCVLGRNEFAAYPPAWNWPVNGLWVWGGGLPSNGEIPPDGVWRTYGFSYDAVTGVGAITISNPAHTEQYFVTPGRDFCGWTSNPMQMFPNLDNGVSSSNFDLTAILDNASYGQITTLPVVLEYFKGEQNGLGVDLSWKTTSEFGNMGFILYRSSDTENWTEFARIDGHSTTGETNTYTLRDETPLSGISFYRLVQVDMNGATTGFPAVKVNVNYTGHELLGIHPNPVTAGTLSIKYESQFDNEPLKVDLLSLNGQLVGHQEFVMQGGLNDLAMDVSGLASGLYIAKVSNGQHTHSQKFSVITGN